MLLESLCRDIHDAEEGEGEVEALPGMRRAWGMEHCCATPLQYCLTFFPSLSVISSLIWFNSHSKQPYVGGGAISVRYTNLGMYNIL